MIYNYIGMAWNNPMWRVVPKCTIKLITVAFRTHERGSIKVAPDSNLSDFTVLLKGVGDSLKDLTIFTKVRQLGTNPCAIDNGGCAELCLYNGTHPVCACAHGLVAEDGKTCKGLFAVMRMCMWSPNIKLRKKM